MMKKEQADNWEPHDEASVSNVSGLHVETFENLSDCIHTRDTTDETIYNQESMVTRSIINQINYDEPPTRDVDSDDEYLPFEERYSDEFDYHQIDDYELYTPDEDLWFENEIDYSSDSNANEFINLHSMLQENSSNVPVNAPIIASQVEIMLSILKFSLKYNLPNVALQHLY
ncbi:hypothetical protein TKK_0016556 [Trichogramma kaykai]